MVKWQRVMRPGGTVYGGDFNAHSKPRDPRYQVQLDAAIWEDLIDKNGLEIGNDGRPTHHWTREDHEGKLGIKLTLGNRPIQKWTILTNDHAAGSDQ